MGIDRNYEPCRFTGGLFCKRWCHSGLKLASPHRMLHQWDKQPHRMSSAAHNFLCGIWKRPAVAISEVNPMLFDGVLALSAVRRVRRILAHMMRDLVAVDFKKVSRAVVSTIGIHRMHMLVSSEMYSYHDLVCLESDQLILKLEALMKMLHTITH